MKLYLEILLIGIVAGTPIVLLAAYFMAKLLNRKPPNITAAIRALGAGLFRPPVAQFEIGSGLI